MSATVDLHLEHAAFRHTVLKTDNGDEFVVFRIETPSVTVNLFGPSSVGTSESDEQTALSLSVAAAEYWCETDRLYRRQARDAAAEAASVPDRVEAVAS